MPKPSRWNDIVDTAAKIFREKGFSATSLEDIASEVGMWKGSLYHYIDSKEDLLFAVVKEPADHLLAEIRRIEGLDLPPAEKLRLAALSHAYVLDTTFVYAAVYLQEVAGRQRFAEWTAMDREYVEILTAIVQQGVDRGDFTLQLSARNTTLALIGSLNWMTHWFNPEGSLSARTIADQICGTFLSGVLTRARREDAGDAVPSHDEVADAPVAATPGADPR